MPDPIFSHPRLAALYDDHDGVRDDLDAYEAIAEELEAERILDVGCGTGSLALRLVATGHDVIGVDPSAASLAVAQSKPGADHVRWIEGDATTLPPDVEVDLAVMTGNVAQVFTTDEAWAATLSGIRRAVRPGGHLVFETRRPEARAWEGWTPEATRTTVRTPTGDVETWCEVLDAAEPLVTFRWRFRFADGELLTSDSTLRFRTEEEVREDLLAVGFGVPTISEAPDRPGLEMVFVTPRPG